MSQLASQTPPSQPQAQGAQPQQIQGPSSLMAGSIADTCGKPRDTRGERPKRVRRGYMASFLLVGVMIPVVSSIILIALCFLYGGSGTPPIWPVLRDAHLLTVLLWLVAAVICYRFATADSAKVDSYGLLIAHLCQLRAKLGLKKIDGDDELKQLMKKCPEIKEAIKQIQPSLPQNRDPEARNTALASYIDIRKLLVLSPTGPLWAFGTGYCNAWRLLHQAEEAIIAFDRKEEIIYGAMNDEMALQGSAIPAKDELLETLNQAVKVLEPKAEVYFKDFQSNNKCTIPTDFEKALTQFLSNHTIQYGKDNDEYVARCALRWVRRVINSFRDRGWEGLLRARNRLLAAITITRLVTHVLLCVAILSGAPNGYLLAVTAFYLVGAVAGLFGRFYREWTAGSTVDDFGYSIARLVATPLLSGLAGVGGVLLTVMLAPLGGLALASLTKPLDLEQIFHIVPQFLLLAAIFGLTPNLLITGLQNTAKKYESDILSSKVAQQSAAVC